MWQVPRRGLHGDFIEVPSRGADLGVRVAATVEAMERGVHLIYQAALTAGPWLGYADFLVRVDEPCSRWAWSYEPWDAKLARSPKPEHVLQIAIYGDLLGAVQGRAAHRGALMLGTGEPASPYTVEEFQLDEVRYYVRRAARRLEAFAADLPTGLAPEPCGYCGKCEWSPACEAEWTACDHLCRVADITKRQTGRLRESGIPTMSLLARLDWVHVAGIAPGTLARLAQQVRLQKESAAAGAGAYELLPHGPGLGFDRLPAPDPGDLFFDFEGDPMHPGGLEYLCGVLWRAAAGEADGEPVPGQPGLRFRAFWAHDRAQEKRAFAELTAFLVGRLARAPDAHLYHYAPYEKTALGRLSSLHSVAEDDVDEILRSGRMVDLYRVVREGVRVGEASYSIKSLERFYMPARTTEVASGGDSLVIYDAFRQTGDAPLLDAIRDYNRDDCLSTLLLRDWLAGRAEEAGRGPPAPRNDGDGLAPETEEERARRAGREAMRAAQKDLEDALTADGRAGDAEARQLMADLVGFHRREDKPAWWAFFDRQERGADELQDDGECLGGCEAADDDWVGQDKRSLTFRYRYPEQETKLREGDAVYLAATGEAAGAIASLDEAARTVVLRRGVAKGPFPRELSLIPNGPIDAGVLRDAVWTAAADTAAGGKGLPHIGAMLRREPPRLRGRVLGAPIVPIGDRDDPARLLAAATDAVHALDRSWLVIQGPPGAGKTYTISHLIISLIKAGKTVGVASNSHKAIDNVLHAVEMRLIEAGEKVRLLGQKKDGAGEGFEGKGFIASVSENKKIDPAMSILGDFTLGKPKRRSHARYSPAGCPPSGAPLAVRRGPSHEVQANLRRRVAAFRPRSDERSAQPNRRA